MERRDLDQVHPKTNLTLPLARNPRCEAVLEFLKVWPVLTLKIKHISTGQIYAMLP